MDTSVIDSAEQRVGKETVRSRTDKPDQSQNLASRQNRTKTAKIKGVKNGPERDRQEPDRQT